MKTIKYINKQAKAFMLILPMFFGGAVAFGQTAEIYHEPSMVEVQVGDTFTVDIMMSVGVDPISAFEVRMKVDPLFIEVVQITDHLNGAYDYFQNPAFDNASGKIGMAGMKFNETIPSEDLHVVSVTFTALQASDFTQVIHPQDQFPRTALAYAGENKLGEIGGLDISIAAGEALGINPEEEVDDLGLKVWPNPVFDTGSISFEIPGEEGQVQLGIYDMSGRLIRTVFSGQAASNVENKFEVDFRGLSSGNYICRLTAGDLAQAKRIVVAR